MQVPDKVINREQLHLRLPCTATVPTITSSCLRHSSGAPAIISRQPVQGDVTYRFGVMATVQEERVDSVEFVIKNPARSTTPPFILRARVSATVSDLKKQLQAEYNGKPDPQTQTVLLLLYACYACSESHSL